MINAQVVQAASGFHHNIIETLFDITGHIPHNAEHFDACNGCLCSVQSID
jgi:hypothetical protein